MSILIEKSDRFLWRNLIILYYMHCKIQYQYHQLQCPSDFPTSSTSGISKIDQSLSNLSKVAGNDFCAKLYVKPNFKRGRPRGMCLWLAINCNAPKSFIMLSNFFFPESNFFFVQTEFLTSPFFLNVTLVSNLFDTLKPYCHVFWPYF